MNYLLTLIFISAITIWGQGQDKEITLTVSGTGQTPNEAKERALRNAIEQAFGAFISSRTEILNDELISDQITSLTNGNITSYEIINEAQIPNGGYATTVKAIVSVNKLISFVEAKGVKVEINGGLFALNVKQQILNEQAEIKVVYEMISMLHEVMQTSFDFSISSTEPKSLDSENTNWEIPLTVQVSANKNIEFCSQYLVKILSAISLTTEDVQNYKSLNKQVFPIELTFSGVKNSFNLRKLYSLDILKSILNNWNFYMSNFEVNSGINSPVKFMELRSLGSNMLFVPWKSYENDYSRTLRILLPSTGQLVYKYSVAENKTLSEIENITGYSIKPKGTKSKIKAGGYVVYEENGHGLVVSLLDFITYDENIYLRDNSSFNFDEAKKKCDDYTFSGFDDWRLPEIHELELIYKNLGEFGIRDFDDIYWSGTIANNYPALTFDFYEGKVFNPREASYSADHRFSVLAVRKF
jgi:hypothetical protein